MDLTELSGTLSALEEQVAHLSQENQKLAAEFQDMLEKRNELAEQRDRYRELYQQMLELNKKLELGILGQKTEKLTPENQLTIDVLATLLNTAPEHIDEGGDVDTDGEADSAECGKRHGRGKHCNKPGRNKLPDNLPRVDVEILPEEVKRLGLDAFKRIGEETCETVEYRPASYIVVRTIRPKFIAKDQASEVERDESSEDAECDESVRVLTAEPFDLPIMRGLAGPGLLAITLVRRFADHLPVHRQVKIFQREGLPVARSTIHRWHNMLTALAQPLIDAMWDDARTAPYLCVDATGVLVQAKERCRRGHFWVAVAPERHVMFSYSAKHNSAAVDEVLADYSGYLVADAHTVYDHLYVGGQVIEVGCWSHARRYFFKALTSSPELAREALNIIGRLFAIERKIADVTPKKRKQIRGRKSKPVVDALFAWCDSHRDALVDESPIAKAIGYVTNQKDALQRFLEDGRLPLHNNISELQLRREAVGRKNWLFIASDETARVNTTFVTLIASCQMHGLEPWAYLRDLFCLLPRWPVHRVLELAPAYWRQTLEQPETQQLLAENVFRRVALGESVPHGPDG